MKVWKESFPGVTFVQLPNSDDALNLLQIKTHRENFPNESINHKSRESVQV